MKESLSFKASEELKLQQEINSKKEELARLSQEVQHFKSRTEKLNLKAPKIKFKGKNCSKSINSYQEEFNSSQFQRESLPAERFQMVPFYQERVEEVNSNISAGENNLQQISLSAVSSVLSDQDNLLDMNFAQNIYQSQNEEFKQLDNAQEEEQLRYFYGLCLNQKLKYKSKDLAQYVQISQLYEVRSQYRKQNKIKFQVQNEMFSQRMSQKMQIDGQIQNRQK